MEDDVRQVTNQTIPIYDISLEDRVPIQEGINQDK